MSSKSIAVTSCIPSLAESLALFSEDVSGSDIIAARIWALAPDSGDYLEVDKIASSTVKKLCSTLEESRLPTNSLVKTVSWNTMTSLTSLLLAIVSRFNVDCQDFFLMMKTGIRLIMLFAGQVEAREFQVILMLCVAKFMRRASEAFQKVEGAILLIDFSPNSLHRTTFFQILSEGFKDLSGLCLPSDALKAVHGYLSILIMEASCLTRAQSPEDDNHLDMMLSAVNPYAPRCTELPDIVQCSAFEHLMYMIQSSLGSKLSRELLSEYVHSLLCDFVVNMSPVLQRCCQIDRKLETELESSDLNVAYNGVKNNVQIDYSPKRLDVQDTTVHTDVLTKSHSGYHFRLVPCLLELCAVVLKDIKASSTYPANGLCLKSNQSQLNFFVRKFGPLFFQECVQTSHSLLQNLYLLRTVSLYLRVIRFMIRDQESAQDVVSYLAEQDLFPDMQLTNLLSTTTNIVQSQFSNSKKDSRSSRKGSARGNASVGNPDMLVQDDFISEVLSLYEALYFFLDEENDEYKAFHSSDILGVAFEIVCSPASPQIISHAFLLIGSAATRESLLEFVLSTITRVGTLAPMNGTKLLHPNHRAGEYFHEIDMRSVLKFEHGTSFYPKTLGYIVVLYSILSSAGVRSSETVEATDSPTRHSFLGSRPRNKIIIEERQLKPFLDFTVETLLLVGYAKNADESQRWCIIATGLQILLTSTVLSLLKLNQIVAVVALVENIMESLGENLSSADYLPQSFSTAVSSMVHWLFVISFHAPLSGSQMEEVSRRVCRNSQLIYSVIRNLRFEDTSVRCMSLIFLCEIWVHYGMVGSLARDLCAQGKDAVACEDFSFVFSCMSSSSLVFEPGKVFLWNPRLWLNTLDWMCGSQSNARFGKLGGKMFSIEQLEECMLWGMKSLLLQHIIQLIHLPLPSMSSIILGLAASSTKFTRGSLLLLIEDAQSVQIALDQPLYHSLCLECLATLLSYTHIVSDFLLQQTRDPFIRIAGMVMEHFSSLRWNQVGWAMHCTATCIRMGYLLTENLPDLSNWLPLSIEMLPETKSLPNFSEYPRKNFLTGTVEHDLDIYGARALAGDDYESYLRELSIENKNMFLQYEILAFCQGWADVTLAYSSSAVEDTLICHFFKSSIVQVFIVVEKVRGYIKDKQALEKTVLDLLTSANVMLDFLFSHDALHSVDDDFQVAICKSLVEAVISFAEFTSYFHVLSMFSTLLSTGLTHNQCKILKYQASIIVSHLVKGCLCTLSGEDLPFPEQSIIIMTQLISHPTLAESYIEALDGTMLTSPLTTLFTHGWAKLNVELYNLLTSESEAKWRDSGYTRIAERFSELFSLQLMFSGTDSKRPKLIYRVLDAMQQIRTSHLIKGMATIETVQLLGSTPQRVEGTCALFSPLLELMCTMLSEFHVQEQWSNIVTTAETISSIMPLLSSGCVRCSSDLLEFLGPGSRNAATVALSVQHCHIGCDLNSIVIPEDGTPSTAIELSLTRRVGFLERVTRLIYLLSLTEPLQDASDSILPVFDMRAIFESLLSAPLLFECVPWHVSNILRNLCGICAQASNLFSEPASRYIPLGEQLIVPLLNCVQKIADWVPELQFAVQERKSLKNDDPPHFRENDLESPLLIAVCCSEIAVSVILREMHEVSSQSERANEATSLADSNRGSSGGSIMQKQLRAHCSTLLHHIEKISATISYSPAYEISQHTAILKCALKC